MYDWTHERTNTWTNEHMYDWTHERM